MITEEFGNPWMSNLQEIGTPDPVSMIPQTPAWYVLAGIVGLALLWAAWRVYKHWRADEYRREALRDLDAIETSSELNRLPALLKRTALTAYPRAQVASLSGDAWLAFLDGTLGGREFTQGPGRLLFALAYSPGRAASAAASDLGKLTDLSRRWIRRHRRASS